MGIDIRRSMGLDPPSRNTWMQRRGKPHPTICRKRRCLIRR